METILIPDWTVSNEEGSNFYYRKISQGNRGKSKTTPSGKTGLRAENLNVYFRKKKHERQPLRACYIRKHTVNRLRLKCEGTRAETRVRLSAKRTSPFKSAGASVVDYWQPRCAHRRW